MLLSMLKYGRVRNCPAPAQPCICEARLCAATGALALIAGLVQLSVGYRYSMAVLSDSLHAFSDALADFVGMGIAHHVRNKPYREKKLRSVGDKVIAILLAVGAIVIGLEAHDRWSSDSYLVWLPAAIAVALFGLGIDQLRLRMLTQARKHSGNENLRSLIEHAKYDRRHSGIISVILLLTMAVELLNLEEGLYTFLVHLVDYLASLGLAMFMLFVATPNVWRGQGCVHDVKINPSTKHSDHCNHNH